MHVARVLLFASAVLVASCSDSGLPAVPEPGGPAAGAGVYAAPPLAAPTGSLTVVVTDPEGKPLSNATVFVNGNGFTPGFNNSYSQTHATDHMGVATFDATPRYVSVCANHARGGTCKLDAEVAQSGRTSVSVVIEPASPITVALLPVAAGSLGADRAEFDFRVSLFASEETGFVPHSYWRENATPVFLRVDSCWVHLDHFVQNPPTCSYYEGSRDTRVLEYAFDPIGTPPMPVSGPFSALLLLEQSRRVDKYDPYGERTRAAKYFVEYVNVRAQDDQIAVAGFAGQSASIPALLPQLPLWVASSATTPFSANRLVHLAAVDALHPLVGGNAPVLEALSAAISLVAVHTPTAHRRAIVAMLGGADDSGLSDVQRRNALAELRQKQGDTGVQVVLVVGRLDAESAERTHLAELAAALRAPIIYAGYPSNWLIKTDGLQAAMDLAADLLTGLPMPSVKATFRMKAEGPGGFEAGSFLHGTIYVESDQCPMGCGELPYQFAVEVP